MLKLLFLYIKTMQDRVKVKGCLWRHVLLCFEETRVFRGDQTQSL